MRAAVLIVLIMLLWPGYWEARAGNADDVQKSEGNKGLTIEDVGRGLKSAAQSIEKEIPKIGPAIVDTTKKLTGKDSSQQSSPAREQPKK